MTIEPDVAHVARHQDGASALAPRLLQAVVNSERNIVRATECTVANVTSRIEAIEIAGRTWNHFAWDFIEAHCLDAFLEFAGNRWAPQGAANDPKGLNKNFIPNMRKFLGLDV